ncbi:MAG: hypothetical protein ACKV2Q_17260 [Planctomycetaceae bacterium]
MCKHHLTCPLPRRGGPLEQRRLGHARSAEADQQRPIHQRQQLLQVRQPRIASQGPCLLRQFADDRSQQFGIEDLPCLRERPQRHSRHTEFLLHRLQLRGLLQAAQRVHDRIEEEQQHQDAVLVEMQVTVTGRIPLATNLVQPLKQRQQFLEILQPRDILVPDLLLRFA